MAEEELPHEGPVALDLHSPSVQALVRRLFFARHAERVRAQGVDPDEALQEVWVKLLRAARSSPYDPTRGSPSTYLNRVIFSATANYLRAVGRQRLRDGQPFSDRDAAELNRFPVAW